MPGYFEVKSLVLLTSAQRRSTIILILQLNFRITFVKKKKSFFFSFSFFIHMKLIVVGQQIQEIRFFYFFLMPSVLISLAVIKFSYFYVIDIANGLLAFFFVICLRIY